jgi:hypothetical protein
MAFNMKGPLVHYSASRVVLELAIGLPVVLDRLSFGLVRSSRLRVTLATSTHERRREFFSFARLGSVLIHCIDREANKSNQPSTFREISRRTRCRITSPTLQLTPTSS